MKDINKIKNQKGVILIMSMMILALMMSSVLALARIIMGEIKMTRNIDNSIIAFYTAESGIEKVLYYIKYAAASDLDLFSYYFSYSDEEGYLLDYDYGDIFIDDPERKIKITEASIEAENWEAFNIQQYEVVHVDIINPGGDIYNANDFFHNKNNYQVKWFIEDCTEHIDERLEISLEYFGQQFTNPGTSKFLVTCSSCSDNLCSGDGTNSFTSNIDEDKYYRFSFNPLENEDTNPYTSSLLFRAFDDAGNEGILSEISIKVEGKYRNSIQHLQARLPALGSVSDIFSFVIFSGETLEKFND